MQKQILAHWIDGWTIENIAIKHKLSVDEVTAAIRGFWL
jgi:hypothetical protein